MLDGLLMSHPAAAPSCCCSCCCCSQMGMLHHFHLVQHLLHLLFQRSLLLQQVLYHLRLVQLDSLQALQAVKEQLV